MNNSPSEKQEAPGNEQVKRLLNAIKEAGLEVDDVIYILEQKPDKMKDAVLKLRNDTHHQVTRQIKRQSELEDLAPQIQELEQLRYKIEKEGSDFMQLVATREKAPLVNTSLSKNDLLRLEKLDKLSIHIPGDAKEMFDNPFMAYIVTSEGLAFPTELDKDSKRIRITLERQDADR